MFAPPTTEMSFFPAAALACSSALSMPSVTKLNVVPPSFVSAGLDLWVTTKTGMNPSRDIEMSAVTLAMTLSSPGDRGGTLEEELALARIARERGGALE